jgi:hypothetical protein
MSVARELVHVCMHAVNLRKRALGS